jgi:uncharacterized membrane protein
LGSLGQLEFKRGSRDLTLNPIELVTNIHIIIGLIFYGISTLIYIYALKEGELSLLYPVIATSYIWTTLLANIILGETVHILNWIGIMLIIFGVSLIVAL